ncbi:MAG: disulfide bond formation protein B [Sphingomonadales bacterium]|nr:disulfide bond formation protein B [Sphingomonadales bacterium]
MIALSTPLSQARLIALAVPAALLAGAYGFQYIGGLFPCELCWWQRYGHFAALALALLSFAAPRHRLPVILAGLGLAASALVGAYHAGIEYKWWQGFTACTSAVKFGGGDPLAAIMAAPTVRCDDVQWSLFGISMAGYNFLVSGAAALAVFALAGRARKGA